MVGRWAGPLAASVALLVAGAWWLDRDRGVVSGEAVLSAALLGGAVQSALETLPSGEARRVSGPAEAEGIVV